jgi:DinB superfamily
MTNDQIFVKTALTAWNQWASRATKLFDSLTDEQMLTPIVPGKNRPVYLLGHVLVVNDSMIPQLRLGDPDHANLREAFVTQPDNSATAIPTVSELREFWKASNARLTALFEELTPAQWLERHSAISEEDFVNEPHRNRLAILLSRTSHNSYHVGQLLLFKK